MRVLEIARYKENFLNHVAPFVTEQGEAIAKCLRNRVNSEELIVNSGYNGQVLRQIYGRTSDVLRLDNGHVLTSPGFTILMRDFPVKAYDIQKLSGSYVRMQVVVADGWTKEDEKKLIKEMERFCGEGCEFALEYVEKFEPLKNGKRQYFMNDLSL